MGIAKCNGLQEYCLGRRFRIAYGAKSAPKLSITRIATIQLSVAHRETLLSVSLRLFCGNVVCPAGAAQSIFRMNSVSEEQSVGDDLAFKGLPAHLQSAQHGAPAVDQYFAFKQPIRDR